MSQALISYYLPLHNMSWFHNELCKRMKGCNCNIFRITLKSLRRFSCFPHVCNDCLVSTDKYLVNHLPVTWTFLSRIFIVNEKNNLNFWEFHAHDSTLYNLDKLKEQEDAQIPKSCSSLTLQLALLYSEHRDNKADDGV